MPGMLQQAAGAAQQSMQEPMQGAPVESVAPEQAAMLQQAMPMGSSENKGDETSEIGAAKTKTEPATAEEQAEYKRAISALTEVLYGNDDTSDSVVKALRDTPRSKIDPIVKISLLVIQQIDEKIDLDEAVIAQFTADVVDRLIEISEVRYKTKYSDKEMQQVLGATWEGVIGLFDGAEQGEFDNFTSTVHPDDIAQGEKMYKELTSG